MIVVVIIGILAAIAFPNYRQFVARAKRTEAKAALLQVATNQEKFYLQNSTFTTNMMLLGFATNPYVTDTGTYSVSVTVADASNFTAVATYLFADEEAAKRACETILREFPNAIERDFLNVSYMHGFDIGIASYWSSENALSIDIANADPESICESQREFPQPCGPQQSFAAATNPSSGCSSTI